MKKSIFRLLLLSLLLGSVLFNTNSQADAPTDVSVTLKVDQITSVDQKAENFGVVGSLALEWNEPKMAAKAGEKLPPERFYLAEDLAKVMTERQIIWPAYSFFNQQGRMHYQNRIATVDPKGNIFYYGRFSATFQAPDFDFVDFPLDHQRFYLMLDLLPPADMFQFVKSESASGLGDALGEEEWILDGAEVNITTHNELDVLASRFILSFEGSRHLNYYVVRILIPVIIIILVSWFSFFLNDYTKRIDLAGANLLLFIAFNFSVADDLPRLGYMTLMDTFMLATFAITGMVVLMSVWLRRLQNHGKGELADKLDNFAITAYPLAYAGAGLAMLWKFYF